ANLNSLVDHRVIEALYAASQAGVPIEILARGICCLRPGVPGLSETIRVTSIVDRFLEHSRIFVFGVGDDAKVFLSSGDWMPRNFFRRVEVMFPILSADLRERVLEEIIPTYLSDTARARRLDAKGVYHLPRPRNGDEPLRSQIEFLTRVAQQSQSTVTLPESKKTKNPMQRRTGHSQTRRAAKRSRKSGKK
ncbi:MAG: hypothetical protein ABGW78_11465, partial [Pirellulales bacterium]